MSELILKQIKKSFGPVEVIHGVDLTVKEGEFVVFVGPSGCGKSTMLRMIAGLETITEGQLMIGGKVMNDEAPVKRGIAMVFQSYALYPNMTVRQNMSFGLQQAGLPRTEIKDKVNQASETLKLEKLMDRRPGELSGGQSQRVAIGRAIVRDPDLFLFDEPLSNLDAELRVHMRVEIKALHERLQRTMIYVTHDQVEAMTMADRIVVFNAGNIEQVGTPLELYNSPDNLFVAGFIGSPRMNFLDTHWTESGELEIPGGKLPRSLTRHLEPGQLLTVGIRPEHFAMCSPEDALLSGAVSLIEQLGGESFLHVMVAGLDKPVIVRLDGQPCIRAGDDIPLTVRDHMIYCFDKVSGKAISIANSDINPTHDYQSVYQRQESKELVSESV